MAMKRICVQCGKEFVLSNSEIHYYRQRKLYLPKRCSDCRAINKAKKQETTKTNVPVEKKGFFAKILSIFKK